MATRPGDINADVGIALDTQGMSGGVRALQEQIGTIIKSLNEAGATAERAIKSGGRAGAEAVAQMNQQIRVLAQLQGSVKNLTQTNTRNLFGGFQSANQTAKMASDVERFFRGLEAGSPTVEKLTSRLTMMNQQAAQLLSSGQTVPRNFWDRRLNIQNALESFKKIDTSYQRMVDRINNLSPAGQAKLAPGLAAFQTAIERFDRMAANPRSSGALQTRVDALRQMSLQLANQIKLTEQEDAASQSLLRSTRARADALLSMTFQEQKLQLLANANRYSTLLAGRSSGGQFSDVVGSPIANIQKSGMDALAQSTKLATAAKMKLDAAMVNQLPQERIAQLTARFETLKDMQAQSLALANREKSAGFFSGILQGVQTVSRGPGGEGIGLGGIGNLIGRVGAFTAAFRAINMVSSAISQAAAFTVQWEDQLAQLQAISGATGQEMMSLSQNILDVSKNSASTISEITDAAKILAQAGYSARETGELLQNVVDLSAASGASPAEAVDILTSSMGAFNLQVSDSSHIVDALVTTLNRTKLSVNQVQLGLQYLGAAAQENNLKFEDLVSILGAAADAGIRSGSTMATGTRQLLIDLQTPSKKLIDELTKIGLTMGDVDVKTRGFIPVLQDLHDHGFNAFQAIETRAAAMYGVLSENIDEMKSLRQETLQTNTAHEAAAKRLNSLAAMWTETKNNLSEFAVVLGQLVLPLLKGALVVFNALADVVRGVGQIFVEFVVPVLNAVTGVDMFSKIWGESTDALDRAQTSLNDATAAVNDQRQKIHSLESEMQDLIAKQASGAISSDELRYSIDRLADRFPGLREELEKTGTTTQGLIEALDNLDAKARETLATYSEAQAKASKETLDQSVLQANSLRQQMLNKYPAPNAAFRFLNNQQIVSQAERENKIISLLTTPRSDPHWRVNVDQGKQLFNLFKADSKIPEQVMTEFSKDVSRLITVYESAQRTQDNLNQQLTTAAASRYTLTPDYKRLHGYELSDSALATSLESQTQGLDLEARRTKIAPLIKTLHDHISELTTNIDKLTKEGNTAAVKVAKSIKTSEENTLKRVTAIGEATDEESKEALKTAKARTLTSQEMRSALEKEFKGIRIGSGYRGPGSKVYKKGSWHSNMPGGHALDILGLPSGVTMDNVVRFMETLGQSVDYGNKNSFFDERRPPPGAVIGRDWTGPHTHIGWTAKDSRAQSEAMRQAQQDARENDRRQQELERMRLDARKRELDNTIKSLDNAKDMANIEETMNTIQTQERAYAEQQIAAFKADAKRRGFKEGTEQYKDMEQAVMDDIVARHEATVRQEAQAIANVITKFLGDTQKLIEYHFNQSLAKVQSNLNRQQGLLEGLDNPRLAGQVPDYVKVVQQRRVDLANQQVTDQTMAANTVKIREYNALLDSIQNTMEYLNTHYPQQAVAAWQTLQPTVAATEDALRGLNVEQAKFIAQAQAAALVPQSWHDAISQAAQAWQIQNNAGLTLNQRLWGGLGEAIDSVGSSFQQFFVDVMSGTKGIAAAFGDMAKAVMQAMAEMAAKAIATQIFSLLLSFIPGASSTNGIVVTGGAPSNFLPITPYRGGLIESQGRAPKRYAQGGFVSSGIPTRDTVPSLLSRGEFVMQRSAAESIGHRLLMDMNNRGAAALDKMGKNTVVMPDSKPVETNVYVVLPEEKPSLGPNDVLAVVQNDVLRNGATKALIKTVANGG